MKDGPLRKGFSTKRPGSGPNEYDEASPRSEPAVANSTSDMRKTRENGISRQMPPFPDGLAMHEGICYCRMNMLPWTSLRNCSGVPEASITSCASQKRNEIEKKGGYISRLSIPDNELRQCRDELLKERFGKGIRMLGTDERLLLGKLLKRKYNCSTKQNIRMVSLAYSQIKDLL